MLIRLIISLLISGFSGWIAGKIMNSEGGMGRNIILGIIGGVVGSIALGLIGISGHGLIGNILVSVVGACIVIFGYHAITKK